MEVNEKYLHNIIMSSINNLIKEDINGISVDYLSDIKNGIIDDIDYKGGNVVITVIGDSDTTLNSNDESDIFADYKINCYVRLDQVSAGNRGDYYNPPEEADFDKYLYIESVIFSNDGMRYKNITKEIDEKELKLWVENIIDWDSVDNYYTWDDREWDTLDD